MEKVLNFIRQYLYVDDIIMYMAGALVLLLLWNLFLTIGLARKKTCKCGCACNVQSMSPRQAKSAKVAEAAPIVPRQTSTVSTSKTISTERAVTASRVSASTATTASVERTTTNMRGAPVPVWVRDPAASASVTLDPLGAQTGSGSAKAGLATANKSKTVVKAAAPARKVSGKPAGKPAGKVAPAVGARRGRAARPSNEDKVVRIVELGEKIERQRQRAERRTDTMESEPQEYSSADARAALRSAEETAIKMDELQRRMDALRKTVTTHEVTETVRDVNLVEQYESLQNKLAQMKYEQRREIEQRSQAGAGANAFGGYIPPKR